LGALPKLARLAKKLPEEIKKESRSGKTGQ